MNKIIDKELLDKLIETYQKFLKTNNGEYVNLAIEYSDKIDSVKWSMYTNLTYEYVKLNLNKEQIYKQYEGLGFSFENNILDDVEVKFLESHLDYVKDKIICIVKCDFKDNYYIKFYLNNGDYTAFANFKNKNMYKGMEINKTYTTKQLGLWKDK